MRLLALIVLLAVLPTTELVEQVTHVVEHLLEAEAPDHSAHHGGDAGDEHGCTGLVHLCACHHAQVTEALRRVAIASTESPESLIVRAPPPLIDLNSLEPPHRPPIA